MMILLHLEDLKRGAIDRYDWIQAVFRHIPLNAPVWKSNQITMPLCECTRKSCLFFPYTFHFWCPRAQQDKGIQPLCSHTDRSLQEPYKTQPTRSGFSAFQDTLLTVTLVVPFCSERIQNYISAATLHLAGSLSFPPSSHSQEQKP